MPVLYNGPSAATAAVALARMLPVVIVTVLAIPCWLAFPFLPRDRRSAVLDLLTVLIAWTRAAWPGTGGGELVPAGARREESDAATRQGPPGYEH